MDYILREIVKNTQDVGFNDDLLRAADYIVELEQRLAKANARIAELKIKEFMYDEHRDAVKKCLALNKQLVATEKALRWVCDVYIVGHYYSDDQRKEQLERTVRRVMVKANGGE